jgi:hypothetical protein
MTTAPPVDAPVYARIVRPGSFEAERHYYPRVLNAQMSPLVRAFLHLGNERILQRYAHLNPKVDADALREILNYKPRFFPWAGCDLIHVTTEAGFRHMVVIETNSCPSGQKSLPLDDDMREHGSYRLLIEKTVQPWIEARRPPTGALAVLYDKNEMEASGYAATLADIYQEPILLTPCFANSTDPAIRWDDGVLHVRDPEGAWQPIRAAFRYVTQRPWTRIPLHTRTVVLNPVLACLAGGRNKMVAAKAYDLANADWAYRGFQVRTPETIWDVNHNEIPLWVQRLGGHAVVKVPYSNAGQGVFTITTPAELEAFMAKDQRYERYIVQSLIGNRAWGSVGRQGRLYHVGTLPNKRLQSYVADLRVMVGSTDEGWVPIAMYARRAREPLTEAPPAGTTSWDVLGTNLSMKKGEGGWDTDTSRLLLMDRKDFNSLGLGIDDLTEAYVQTVLAVVAIDQMAARLTSQKGKFRWKLFRSLNDDEALIREIEQGTAR